MKNVSEVQVVKEYNDIVVTSLGTQYVDKLDKTKLFFEIGDKLQTAWTREGHEIKAPAGQRVVVTVAKIGEKTYYNA